MERCRRGDSAARDAGLLRDVAASGDFVTGLTTDIDVSPRRGLLSAGGQLDVRFSVLSALDLTLSGGAGVTAEEGAAPRREVMISLKVLR